MVAFETLVKFVIFFPGLTSPNTPRKKKPDFYLRGSQSEVRGGIFVFETNTEDPTISHHI